MDKNDDVLNNLENFAAPDFKEGVREVMTALMNKEVIEIESIEVVQNSLKTLSEELVAFEDESLRSFSISLIESSLFILGNLIKGKVELKENHSQFLNLTEPKGEVKDEAEKKGIVRHHQ